MEQRLLVDPELLRQQVREKYRVLRPSAGALSRTGADA
jgi:hypothetical protein